jgi:hypothetical protein
MESIACTLKERRYFAGVGRVLHRMIRQSVRQLPGDKGRWWTDVGTVMNLPVSQIGLEFLVVKTDPSR